MFVLFLCTIQNTSAQTLKYSLRTKTKTAFFYVNEPQKPTEIYYRESTDKEKIKMEVMGEYGNFQGDYDTTGEIKVKNPRTKKVFTLRPQHFNLLITYENGSYDNFLWERSFDSGKAKLYAIVSPVGFGTFYYMASPQSAPEEGMVENMPDVLEKNAPYKVTFAKEGKVEFTENEVKKTITFKNSKGKKIVFVEKE